MKTQESLADPNETSDSKGITMSTKIFVNLPVKDLKNSMRFYEALGYKHNPHVGSHVDGPVRSPIGGPT